MKYIVCNTISPDVPVTPYMLTEMCMKLAKDIGQHTPISIPIFEIVERSFNKDVLLVVDVNSDDVPKGQGPW